MLSYNRSLTAPVLSLVDYPNQFYIWTMENDIHGGLATISEVVLNPDCPQETNRIYIYVEEVPGVSYNYWALMRDQAKLKERYGDQAAYPDPDYD